MTTRTSPAPAGLLRPSLHCLAFAVALGSAGAALAKDVTWEDIANDDKTTGDVLQYGMGTHAQRWSPLKQVNADNVFKLTPAWSYSFGDEKQRGQESQAIVSDGVIYVTASYSRLFALDAKTGKRLWTYNHRLPDDIRPCCDVVNRGAAIYGDKVFFGTLDASVVALNKNTGKVVWKKKFADHGAGYTMTGAPTIVKDGKTGKVLLIHGSSGDEFGVVGRLFARDPDTGEEIWMRPFVEGHMGRLNGKDSTVTGDVKAPSWPDDRNSPTGKVESWSHGGGAPWQKHTHLVGRITATRLSAVSTERRRITPRALFALPVQATNIRAPHPLRRANNRSAVIRRSAGGRSEQRRAARLAHSPEIAQAAQQLAVGALLAEVVDQHLGELLGHPAIHAQGAEGLVHVAHAVRIAEQRTEALAVAAALAEHVAEPAETGQGVVAGQLVEAGDGLNQLRIIVAGQLVLGQAEQGAGTADRLLLADPELAGECAEQTAGLRGGGYLGGVALGRPGDRLGGIPEIEGERGGGAEQQGRGQGSVSGDAHRQFLMRYRTPRPHSQAGVRFRPAGRCLVPQPWSGHLAFGLSALPLAAAPFFAAGFLAAVARPLGVSPAPDFLRAAGFGAAPLR